MQRQETAIVQDASQKIEALNMRVSSNSEMRSKAQMRLLASQVQAMTDKLIKIELHAR